MFAQTGCDEAMESGRYRHGFSLIETMIVVGLIMVLVTMVVLLAPGVSGQSAEQTLKGTFAVLDSALEEYHDYWNDFPEFIFPNQDPNKPAYPTSSAALYGELYRTPGCRKLLERISPKLIRNNPTVADMPEIYDPWGRRLVYDYGAGYTYPRLKSAGPDKAFNTGDDITNR